MPQMHNAPEVVGVGVAKGVHAEVAQALGGSIGKVDTLAKQMAGGVRVGRSTLEPAVEENE